MGAAYYVSLEREIPGIRTLQRCGRSMAQNIARLDEAAAALQLMPLSRLLGAGAADLEEILEWGGPDVDAAASRDEVEPLSEDSPAGFDGEPEDGVWALDDEVLPEQWFDATLGLNILRTLTDYVRTHAAAFERAEDLTAELDDMQRILQAAEYASVRFHLTVDV